MINFLDGLGGAARNSYSIFMLLNISFFDTFCMARGDRLWNFQFVKTRGALVGLDTSGIFGSRDYFPYF